MPILTCENHRDLFWMCKSQAVTNDGRYNGARNIFFLGHASTVERDRGYTQFVDETRTALVRECPCSASDLICIDWEGGN